MLKILVIWIPKLKEEIVDDDVVAMGKVTHIGLKFCELGSVRVFLTVTSLINTFFTAKSVFRNCYSKTVSQKLIFINLTSVGEVYLFFTA